MNSTVSTNTNTHTDQQVARLAEAIVQQWTWKTPAMKAMTLAVCKLALKGREFSANDLDEFDHGGRGIAGAVFNRLAADGVIAPVGGWCGTEFIQKHVSNAGGNPVKIWRLLNGALARRALEIHDLPEPQLKQATLI